MMGFVIKCLECGNEVSVTDEDILAIEEDKEIMLEMTHGQWEALSCTCGNELISRKSDEERKGSVRRLRR